MYWVTALGTPPGPAAENKEIKTERLGRTKNWYFDPLLKSLLSIKKETRTNKAPGLGVEKAWTQLCWMRTRRQFFTCEEESSVKRMISWRVRVPRWRRQLHTFCEKEEEALGDGRGREEGRLEEGAYGDEIAEVGGDKADGEPEAAPTRHRFSDSLQGGKRGGEKRR